MTDIDGYNTASFQASSQLTKAEPNHTQPSCRFNTDSKRSNTSPNASYKLLKGITRLLYCFLIPLNRWRCYADVGSVFVLALTRNILSDPQDAGCTSSRSRRGDAAFDYSVDYTRGKSSAKSPATVQRLQPHIIY